MLALATGNTVISQSCRVVIPPGKVIADTGGNGVIQIGASNIEIEFAEGSVLRGSPAGARPDEYKGYGIRVNGHTGVTIRGARLSGFWCGLWASRADGLVLDGIDASDNRRAYLKSTPTAEDGGDWLFGHNNDQKEWLKNYAAAVYIEDSAGVTVRNSRVWHGQNALCLDRVTGSKVYDNDFSFNSGWGIALWRCTRNIISRNAVDFCVRGYSHGVYNRGQDSAGIFVFEQNNENIFAENSATHGGDGFFGFAGREALGEVGQHPLAWYKRRGNTDNVLAGNDFSYAAAHGIENTFSFGNKYLNNRIVGNAICGVWAGYSRETLIAGNDFQDNGEMGYGLERGGVDIDHGGDNTIARNSFAKNQCGVHLWGGANPEFEKKDWAKANGYASTGSIIADNTFHGDVLAFHFRGPGEVILGRNRLIDVAKTMIDEPAYKVKRDEKIVVSAPPTPVSKVFGNTRPVGAAGTPRPPEHHHDGMGAVGPRHTAGAPGQSGGHVGRLRGSQGACGGCTGGDRRRQGAGRAFARAGKDRRVAGDDRGARGGRTQLRAEGAGGGQAPGRDQGHARGRAVAGNILPLAEDGRSADEPRRLPQAGRGPHSGLRPGRPAFLQVRDARAERSGHL